MAKKTHKKFGSGFKSSVAILLLALAGAGGLAAYVTNGGASIIPSDEHRRFSREPRGQERVQVPVPVVGENANLQLQKRDADVKEGESAYLVAVNGFLASFENPNLLAQSIHVDGKVAQVQWSSEFRERFGSRDETTFLLGIQSALGQFAELEAVELYVDGQRLDELGHIAFDEPIPVIRPENWKNPTSSSTTPIPPTGR